MRKLFLITILAVFALTSFSQEKWSTRKPAGVYPKLPSEIYAWQNTNTKIVVYHGQSYAVTVGPSIRVHPNAVAQQDEIVLVRHPSNPNIMFGGANTTVSGVYGQGGYLTTDNGVTWTGNDLLPPFTQSSSDPAPAIDKDGRIIFTTLDNPGIVAAYSTNNGTTWSARVTIQAGSEDKNFAASDDAPTSTYYGRTYCVWSNFALGSPPIVNSYTTNGGVSWSAMLQINTPPSGHYSQGCDIAIGPTGQVYVVWAQVLSAGLTEDYLGFAVSTTGGTSWTVTNNAYDMNGIRGNTFNGWNFRVNSFPRIAVDRSGGVRNGWIYVVASDRNIAPAGSDADVVMHKSTDNGATWNATGVRCNQDALNNGKQQFFPAIRVDEAGGINICYYDNRNYPSVGDSCKTYMSRSTDGGITWTDYLVSDHAWLVKGEAGLGSYGGDYIGISSGNGKVFPFWFDDKTGTMQAWVAAVDLGVTGISNNNNETLDKFELHQNFPNPFNPNTLIDYSVPKAGNVSLEVYDITGKKVATLVNEVKPVGNYRFDFNAGGLASGVYIYTLKTDGISLTKKMLLVK